MMSVPLQLFRASNRLTGQLAPEWTAARARDLFVRPRRAAWRKWEEAVESEAERFRLPTGLSALRWGDGGRGTVLCMHGWEGRSTQFGALAGLLVPLGFRVVGLDGPGHGRSPGREAHPVEFARALLLADLSLGPFHGVVGHSMGAGAASLALSWGLRASRAVLLAGPSSITGVLERYVSFIGLPAPAREAFFKRITRHVGFAPSELDISSVARSLQVPALVVHDRDDREVPFEDGEAIAGHWPGARLVAVEGLGHRRILRDERVLSEVVDFLNA